MSRILETEVNLATPYTLLPADGASEVYVSARSAINPRALLSGPDFSIRAYPGLRIRSPAGLKGLSVYSEDVTQNGILRVFSCWDGASADDSAGYAGEFSAVTYGQTPAAANVPTLATQGLSLENLKGVRAQVYADVGQTLNSATNFRYWLWEPVLNRWLRSDFVYALPGVQDSYVIPDLMTLVPYGRVYLECNTVAVSAGNLNVRMVGF